jgi:hypothetical protein
MTDDFNVILDSDNQVNATVSTTTTIISGSATYVHTQASASSSWVITHSLGRRPSVTIVDSGGNLQIGDVLYNSDNQITVNFSAAFGGYAYLN